jgi:hypothetical protein
MHVIVSRDEMALLLPAAGRYRVRIEEARGIPEDWPQEIELLLRVVPPRPSPPVIRDRFRIRGHAWESLTGMRRLLQMLSFAGVRVVPDTPMDLRVLLGLELLVDIKREPGAWGFPYVCVVGYHKPAAQFRTPCESRNAIRCTVSEPAREGTREDGNRPSGASVPTEADRGSSR